MQVRKISKIAAVVVIAGALAWELARTARLGSRERPAPQSQPESSPLFAPAHRSALGAIRDYFNWWPAPVQPVAYTHKVHLANGMRCLDCHVGVDTGPDGRIPNVELCMTCHSAIDTDNPEIKKVAAYYARGEQIPWQRVYDYRPEFHVKFNHAPHIRAGVDCKTCHGDMRQQTVAVRAVTLTMGYCLNCHKQQGASIDCTTCHY